MTLEKIKAAIPHREPFLLLDAIVEQTPRRIVCRKTFRGDEFWYQGHYPDFPLTPGVILCEAAMQAGALLLADQVEPGDERVPVATRANQVQFRRMVFPGETIDIEAELLDRLQDAFFLKAKVASGGQTAVRLEFSCTLAPRRGP